MEAHEETHVNWIRVLVVIAAVSFSFPVAATDKLEMTCKSAAEKYEISYDKITGRLQSTHSKLSGSIKLGKVQSDEDGTLIWALVPGFSGSLKRDVLVSFRKEKWVKIFYGNGSADTDSCR